MSVILESAVLPETYDNYVFDLYGTLVDIHTDESKKEVWEKLALSGDKSYAHTSKATWEKGVSLVQCPADFYCL